MLGDFGPGVDGDVVRDLERLLLPEPLAGDFIAKYGLRATSSVASALKDLIGRDLLYKMPAGYIVYDRFFGMWLRSP